MVTIKLHQLFTVVYLLQAVHSFSNVSSPLVTRQKKTSSVIGKIPSSSLASSSWMDQKETNAFIHSTCSRQNNSYLTSTFNGNKNKNKNSDTNKKTRTVQNVQGVHPLLVKSLKNIQDYIKKPTNKVASLMAAAFIMFTIVFTPLSEASAAPSGGRMGGSFGGGSSRSSSSRSYSPPARSYNRGYSQGRGYSSGYYSRPNVIVAPSIGGGWGYSSPYYSPGGVAVLRRGPSIVDVFIFGVFAAVIFNAFRAVNDISDGDTSMTMSALGKGVSVAQISVALNVPNKDSPSSILTFLNRLSQTARTDSRVGVSNLASQVALELLRQKRSAFAASSKYTHYQNSDKAQRDYSALAIQERSKFERESISKYGGVDYSQDTSVPISSSIEGDAYSSKATAVVVTIIFSIDGDSTKLPVINSVSDMEQALIRIASDVKVGDCLRSAEVLWTPQDSNDTLSARDVIVDYPELRSI